MMLGEISPQAAVARMRRSPEPAGALDEALPRRRARDQNGGKLDGSYCRATDQFLRSSGLPDEDVEAVMQILGKSAEEEPAAEDSEEMAMRPDPKIGVGGPRGPGGASDRRFALDQYDQFGRPRRFDGDPRVGRWRQPRV
jgi:hypothetical protein